MPLAVVLRASIALAGTAAVGLAAVVARRVRRGLPVGSAVAALDTGRDGLDAADVAHAAADAVEDVVDAAADAAVTLVRTAEEWANTLSHGAGLAASVVGAGVLVAIAIATGSTALVVSGAVFGASLVALYGASTAYHAVVRPERKRRLRLLDHLAILYLIAGTYTPFALVAIGGKTGALLLGLVWAFAAGGTLFKLLSKRRFDDNMTWLYVAMGWLVVLFLKPMVAALSATSLGWLVAGGLCYTGGVFFFLRDRGYDHAVWHAFVLGGSLCHYLAVLGLRHGLAA